ncbi:MULTISPECIES: hypothetical protein [unclassified Variovorax]|jgi:hypothetical protein|uniref:hypothetical protein n=1 Tax=unclassified Variovorax TaxID=663243 RepID=UPI001993CD10|nr:MULTISPECIES: hypothetical protein [unclassified Variovorax]MBC7394685.1 hypothetical protein [Variovorax sp.]MEB0057055.1 hypothetical protein [Variovorax sp. LG9.2]MEB0112248.1 hypothetical protein [Variovorax sp. RTB1]
MHLVVIAWLYVTMMMAVAEATNTTGTVLGASVTFVLYGLLPVGLIMYFMLTPARRRRAREREIAAQEKAREAHQSSNPTGPDGHPTSAPADDNLPSDLPDQRGEAAAASLPPVREKL